MLLSQSRNSKDSAIKAPDNFLCWSSGIRSFILNFFFFLTTKGGRSTVTLSLPMGTKLSTLAATAV